LLDHLDEDVSNKKILQGDDSENESKGKLLFCIAKQNILRPSVMYIIATDWVTIGCLK